MKMEAYSVFDKAVNAFMAPFFCRSRGEALRSFISAVNDEKGPFALNLPDYTLYYIGLWDDASGSLTSPDRPDKVLSAPEASHRVMADHQRSTPLVPDNGARSLPS